MWPAPIPSGARSAKPGPPSSCSRETTPIEEATSVHEAAQALPWKLANAPAGFIEQLVAKIVGIEISIERLEGKWKVSQNRPAADRLGVVAGLVATGTAPAAQMAALVRERL